MLTLKAATVEQAPLFVQMERQEDTSSFILPYTEAKHRLEMAKPDVEYLSIYHQQELVGFVILAHESDDRVEFRRIVVNVKGQGFGQAAMALVEDYCKEELAASSLWLDVFESNQRGVHIYKKLGFQEFKKSEFEGRTLLFMEKSLLNDE